MNEDSTEIVTKAAAKPLNDLAKAFRDQIRAAAAHEEAGDKASYEAARRRAHEAWEELLQSATPAITYNAKAQVRGNIEDLKDFVSELHLILYRELSNLRESKDLWQTKFNLLLKRQAIKLGMQTKEKAQRRVVTVSLDEPMSASEDEGESRFASIPDESSEAAQLSAEVNEILRLVEVKLGAKHLEVFKLRHLEELGWKEISARCGISEKTASTYCERTMKLLREKHT